MVAAITPFAERHCPDRSLEFQVRQTERGADLAVVVDGDLDVAALTADVRDGLRQAGLPGPQVTVRQVEALDRDPLTGKARASSRWAPARPGPHERAIPRTTDESGNLTDRDVRVPQP